MKVLYTYAAPLEGEAIAQQLALSLCMGVGKAASAASLSRYLNTETMPDLLCCFGLAGSYGPELQVGDLCLLGSDQLADEGAQSEQGFISLADMQLGNTGPFVMDAQWSQRLASMLGDLPLVHGATVSTCSATDALALERAQRSGAQVESMEGAAVALTCQLHGIPLVQLRCISNRTGDRDKAGWDLQGAVAKLQQAVLQLHGAQPW